MLRIATGLTKTERGPISTTGLSLFSMSPNRATVSDKANFFSPLAAALPWGGRSTHLLAPRKRGPPSPLFGDGLQTTPLGRP